MALSLQFKDGWKRFICSFFQVVVLFPYADACENCCVLLTAATAPEPLVVAVGWSGRAIVIYQSLHDNEIWDGAVFALLFILPLWKMGLHAAFHTY
mmetsp:Transcript_14210/g.36281  ORF Transcript_14210/g.36281 Transcript_14210/m.36281 type:complete len:96 (+) Transcript_14210:477-764(+)